MSKNSSGTDHVSFNLIKREVQKVELPIFSELDVDDILFIDSSHALKIGSDLSYIFFSIIPALKPGVIIHIHDIWYPWEYPQDMIMQGRVYNEIYFVRSFLQYNKEFEILFFSSFLEKRFAKEIKEKMPDYFKDTGKSLWIRKLK